MFEAVRALDTSRTFVGDAAKEAHRIAPDFWNRVVQRFWNQADLEMPLCTSKSVGHCFSVVDNDMALVRFISSMKLSIKEINFTNKVAFKLYTMTKQNRTDDEKRSYLIQLTKEALQMTAFNATDTDVIQVLSSNLCIDLDLECSYVNQTLADDWMYRLEYFGAYNDEIPDEICWQSEEGSGLWNWCTDYIGQQRTVDLARTITAIIALTRHPQPSDLFLQYFVTTECTLNRMSVYKDMLLGHSYKLVSRVFRRLFERSSDVPAPILWDLLNSDEGDVVKIWSRHSHNSSTGHASRESALNKISRS